MKAIVITAGLAAVLWIGAGSPAWAGHRGTSWSIQIGSSPVYARPVCAPQVIYVQPYCAPMVVQRPVLYRNYAPVPVRGRDRGHWTYEPVGWGRYQPAWQRSTHGRPLQQRACR